MPTNDDLSLADSLEEAARRLRNGLPIVPDDIARTREHKFVMGKNDARSRRMAVMHEGRARRAGVQWEMVDLGVLYHDQSGVCGICGQTVTFREFTVDHIVPLSRGGPHTRLNLQVAHALCNIRKGAS